MDIRAYIVKNHSAPNGLGKTYIYVKRGGKRGILMLFLCGLFLGVACGQDSIMLESVLSIETKGQHNLGALNSNYDCIHCVTGKVADNPLFHLGIYTGISHLLVINKNYSIETGLFLEERSSSHGNNTLSNLVVYPKSLIKVEDKILKAESSDI